VHRVLYRRSGGRFLWTTSNRRGWGALRLTTIGRHSGQQRSVIIGYLEDGPNLVAFAMNGWGEGHPSWWRTCRRIRTPSSDWRASIRGRCGRARAWGRA
jgi:F420H(2)-dependent quinone reductase